MKCFLRFMLLSAACVSFISVGCEGTAGAAELTGLTAADVPSAPREFRGVWVASVVNIDWPSDKNMTPDQQRAEFIGIVTKAVRTRMNAIVLQVRPACDALYPSTLEPWSEFFTGMQGQAPVPFYDPLQFAIEETHKRGMEFHAWFNPYRASHPSETSPRAPLHISNTKPELVRQYGSYMWLDPGEPGVQAHSLAVIMDVVSRYDIDGVHFDDYFYPYQIQDQSGIVDFPDDASWANANTTLSRNDWRRENINKFIAGLYKSIHKRKKWVKFGIAPFGIWKPGNPAGIIGLNAYESLYTDSRLWLASGWVDYFSPQLYWKLDSTGQPFEPLLQWWEDQNDKGRHLWPGLFTGKTANRFSNPPWATSEIVNQILKTRELIAAPGNIHFSHRALTVPDNNGIDEALVGQVYQQTALVPASPWLDRRAPRQPILLRGINSTPSRRTITWTPVGREAAFVWVLYMRKQGQWTQKILPAVQREATLYSTDLGGLPDAVALTAVDRTWNESSKAVLQF